MFHEVMIVFNCEKTILKVWVHNYQNNKNNNYFYKILYL
jgi:predicted alpha/beta superfamily hydrolase